MAAGRESYLETKRAEIPAEVPQDLAEGEPDYLDLMRNLRAIRWDRMPLQLAQTLMSIVEEARTEGTGRIRAREERESKDRCNYCHEFFPGHGTAQGGRHYDQRSWHDLATMQIVSRMSCAKIACRQKLNAEADAERRKWMEARGR